MTQPPPPPGERRLDRPPSDRIAEAAAVPPGAVPPAVSSGSLGLAVAGGTAVGLIGAAVTVLLGGVLAITTGLLVTWAATGHVIGLVVKAGSGPSLAAPRRRVLAAGLALVGVAIGAVGLWAYASSEGGVLPLVDYLAQTFGPFVLVEALVAAGFAWWAAR